MLLAASLVGCGPGAAELTTDGTSTDAATTTEPTGTSGPQGCVPGPVDGELACVPAGPTRADYLVQHLARPGASFDEVCAVDTAVDDGAAETLALTCPSGHVDLTLSTTAPHVPLGLAPGAMVRIQYTVEWDGERPTDRFALRDEADALLAVGVDAPNFPLVFDPLTLDLRSTDCEGVGSDCAVVQAAALGVTRGGVGVSVFGGNAGSLDEFQILVDHATRTSCFGPPELMCGFSYSPSSTAALILRPA